MNKRKQIADYHEQFLLLSETHTLPQICKELDLALSSVNRYLKKNNIDCVCNRSSIKDYHDIIVDCVSNFYNVSEIAMKLNLDAGSIRYYLKSKSISILKVRNGARDMKQEPKRKDRYYVYGHYTLDGTLFYVGKGTGVRLNSKINRSKAWTTFTKENEWYAQVILDNLTENVALSKEKELILSTSNLINIHTESSELNLIGLQTAFYYDENSPTSIKWKISNRQTNHCKRVAGDVAGFKSVTKTKVNQGYRVGYKGKEYKVHRVVLYLHGIDCTGKVVDHIDGDPFNNRLENLRVITQSENCRNMKLRSDSKTGVLGVDMRVIHGTWNYVGKISINGKTASKAFNIKKHGLLPALYKAHEWRKEQIRLLNEQGAGYTERHGT